MRRDGGQQGLWVRGCGGHRTRVSPSSPTINLSNQKCSRPPKGMSGDPSLRPPATKEEVGEKDGRGSRRRKEQRGVVGVGLGAGPHVSSVTISGRRGGPAPVAAT